MIKGEPFDWRFASILCGLTVAALALLLVAARHADDLDVSHVPEPPPAFATMTDLNSAETRIDMLRISVATIEADLARSSAILIAEIEHLKLALAAREDRAAAEAIPKPQSRPRKRSVPDPPASSYIKLR